MSMEDNSGFNGSKTTSEAAPPIRSVFELIGYLHTYVHSLKIRNLEIETIVMGANLHEELIGHWSRVGLMSLVAKEDTETSGKTFMGHLVEVDHEHPNDLAIRTHQPQKPSDVRSRLVVEPPELGERRQDEDEGPELAP